MSTHPIDIFGAGIFGLSVAWTLLRRGQRVRLHDPYPGIAASRGLVGSLSPHVPENWNEKKEFQFQSLDVAASMWRDVFEISGQDPGYARTGRFQPIGDDAALALAKDRAVSAAELWRGRYTWSVIPADDAGLSSPSGWLIHDDLTARLHPRRAVDALHAAVMALGAEIGSGQATKGATQVWATGAAGLRALSADFGREVGTGIKGQAALLDYDMRDAPQIFVDGLHVIPHCDGTTAVGSTTEREFSDANSTDQQLDALIEKAREALPALRGATVLERWADLRPRARSRAPMLGAHPNRPGVYIANGAFKIGFGMAPKAGAVMADLILDGTNNIPNSFTVDANL
ncbi:MAG: FAD-dependent oxidoreductase [Pseudomonadota bacterium]